MEKIDETRPLRWPDADLQPLWPKLRIRTAHDDIGANHKNSRNRNDQSRCRPGQSVCDPAERSSRHRGPLPKWQDRSVTDPAVARDMLEKLPLGQAHLMSFELIPIGPLNPLRQLQGMKANP